jgi:hypothetical protein
MNQVTRTKTTTVSPSLTIAAATTTTTATTAMPNTPFDQHFSLTIRSILGKPMT